jgi:hypothetical protein
MLLGSSTSHKVQVVVGTTGADIEISASVVLVSTASPPVVDGTNTAPIVRPSVTTNVTDDSVVGTASKITRLMEMQVRNNHASTTTDITVQRTDGTSTTTVYKATLLAGESITYNGASTWLHYDTNGAIYPSVGNSATQAEMEAGTATNKYVTPQGVNWHPGVAKFWLRGDTAGGLTANWNVTSLTDTGTGVMGITIATDFSSATGYCCQVSVEATATTWAVANTRECHIRNATLAAGTVSVDCIDNTATTSLVKDPSSWHVMGFGDQA